ncbi:MAG: hypothetical protein SFY96_04320 [Planctomycetota bacterium]|nr:hypothetical protein [Planctomycetota bacterium]
MRIRSRTLKLTTWLSAATLVLLLVCGVASFWGLVLRIETSMWFSSISRGEVSIVRGATFSQPSTRSEPSSIQLFDADHMGYPWGTYQVPRWQLINGRWSEFSAVVPLWLPALVSLGIGVPAFVALRRRARAIKNGACRHCGYALIGIAPAAPCPECGRVRT